MRRGVAALVLVALLGPAARADEHGPSTKSRRHAVHRGGLRALRRPLATAGPAWSTSASSCPARCDQTPIASPTSRRVSRIVREVRKCDRRPVRAGDVLAIIESETLAPYELKAAFDGVVVDKHIAPGETVDRENAGLHHRRSRHGLGRRSTSTRRTSPRSASGERAHQRRATASPTPRAPSPTSARSLDQATRTAIARVVAQPLPAPGGRDCL